MTTLIFVRHAEAAPGDDMLRPLTAAGRAMAAEAAAWLAARGYRPTRVFTTKTERTRETADILLARLGSLPREVCSGLPTREPYWSRFVDGLDGVALLVGHHPTQDFIVRAFGAPDPGERKCAVVVLERRATGWTCIDSWPGR